MALRYGAPGKAFKTHSLERGMFYATVGSARHGMRADAEARRAFKRLSLPPEGRLPGEGVRAWAACPVRLRHAALDRA